MHAREQYLPRTLGLRVYVTLHWRHTAMREAFLIVSILLFIIDAVFWWMPTPPFTGRLTPLGLAFFASSFLAFLPG